MAQTIKLKRSSTAGSVPSTSSLSLGEVAINTYDGKMYIKKDDGSESVVEIGGASSGALPLSGGTLTGNLSLGDDVKAQFGAGNDLQIYHASSDNSSYIRELGAGNLKILGDNVQILNAAGTENQIFSASDGPVYLYHNGSAKFETTSTGIDVTGTATMDGLSVDPVTTSPTAGGKTKIGDSSYLPYMTTYKWSGVGSDYYAFQLINSGASQSFKNSSSIAAIGSETLVERLRIGNNGDISFYEDTGTTPKLFWDASAEQLRVGSTSAIFTNSVIQGVSALGPTIGAKQTVAAQSAGGFWNSDAGTVNLVNFYAGSGGTQIGSIEGSSTGVSLFGTGGTGLTVYGNSGNVGIGTSTPAQTLHLTNTGFAYARLNNSSYTGVDIGQHTNGNIYINNRDNTSIVAMTNNTERLRITSAGNVGIGTSTPSSALDVVGTVMADGLQVSASAGNLDVLLESIAGVANLQFRTGNGTLSSYIRGGMGGTANLKLQTGGAVTRQEIASNGDISFYNDSAAQGLFWDSSTSRLGLGTTVPSNKLHIQGSAITGATSDVNATLYLEQNANNSIQINSGATNNGQIRFGDASSSYRGAISYAHSNDSLSLVTAGQPRLTINSLGNATFSGSVTSTGLTVDGVGEIELNDTTVYSGSAASVGQLNLKNLDTTTAYTPAVLGFTARGTTTTASVWQMGNAGLNSAYAESDFFIKNRTAASNYAQRFLIEGNGDVSFYEDTGTTAKLFWDASAESLGIGTSSPSSFAANANNLVVGSGSGTEGITINSGSANYGVIYFADGTSGSAAYAGSINYNHADNSMRLGTNGSTTDVFINSSGSVGIGTSSPVEKLYVNSTSGDARIGLNAPTGSDAEIKFSNNAVVNYSIGHDDATDNFVIGTDNVDTPLMSVNKAGNVGIGASTALDNKLEVNGGSVRVRGTSTPSVKFNNGDLETVAIKLNSGATGTLGLRDNKVLIDSSGNVGIGVTDPAEKLQVNGNLMVGDDLTAGSFLDVIGAGAGDFGIRFGSEADRDAKASILGTTTTASLRFFTAGANERMVINASGNVGIGTSAPGANLHIGGQEASSPTAGTVDRLHIQPYSNTGGPYKFKARTVGGSSDFLDMYYGSNHIISYGLDGKVGIGTTSPSSALDVVGTVTATAGFTTAANTRVQASSGMLFLNGPSALTFEVGAGSEKMRLTSTGLGIGTSSPTAKLTLADHTTAAGGIKFRTAASSVSLWSSGSGNLNSDASFNTTGRIRVVGGNAVTDPDIGFTGASSGTGFSRATNDITFITAATERMRISGAALLVGKTAANNGTAGVEASAAALNATVSGDTVSRLNRLSSDGEILRFQKDTATVGSIGTNSGLFISSTYGTDSGIRFASSIIAPSTTTGANRDAAIDLGYSSSRFKDLYLSGGALTSTVKFLANTTVSGSDATIFRPADNTMAFSTAGNERMRITAAGLVGIGTTSPGVKLEIGQDNSSTSVGYIRLRGHNTIEGNIYKDATYSIHMDTNSNNGPIRIDGSKQILGITGNVGIGTETPAAKLQVEELGIDTTTTSTTATTLAQIDTFAAATFRSARYTIQATNSTDSTYHITEVLLIHDGTNAYITEYGTMFTGSSEGTISADIAAGNVRLLVTPASTDTIAWKVVRHSILV